MTKEEFRKEELVVNLTIDGIEFKVSNPNKPLREQIQSIVKVFNLPETDSRGTPIQYLLGQMVEGNEEPTVLDFEDEDGHEQKMIDYAIQSGDSLHLCAVPAYSCPNPPNTEQDFYDEDFIIYLTIDGTEYKDIEVKVSDPNKTIRDQISSIIRVFELPEKDNGGNCIQYMLGQMLDEGEEPEILDFEDEYGRECCFMDYNIQPGDCLNLLSIPIAGYACPVPVKMEKEWVQHYLHNN